MGAQAGAGAQVLPQLACPGRRTRRRVSTGPRAGEVKKRVAIVGKGLTFDSGKPPPLWQQRRTAGWGARSGRRRAATVAPAQAASLLARPPPLLWSQLLLSLMSIRPCSLAGGYNLKVGQSMIELMK